MKKYSLVFLTAVSAMIFSGFAGLPLPLAPSNIRTMISAPQIISQSIPAPRKTSPVLLALEQNLRSERALSTSA